LRERAAQAQRYALLDLCPSQAMATSFTALVNHNLDKNDIHTLPNLLNSSWRTIEPLLPMTEGYPVPESSPDKWQWGTNDGGFSLERLQDHGTIMVEGQEFHGMVSDQVFRICHGVRWCHS
jgi:hypothetical protein